MEIGGWQQLTHSVVQPLFSLQSTTIWAMPVAATVILVVLVRTIIAAINMQPQFSSMAIGQLFQHTLTVRIELLCTWMVEYFGLKPLLNFRLFHRPIFLKEIQCQAAYGVADANKSSWFLTCYDRARFLSRGYYYLDSTYA